MAEIVVVGAGMAGMAAAARLSVAGHRVTVYERAETFGGGVQRYERAGFRFDTGPGLLPVPAVYRDLFVKTGRAPLEDCVELSRVDPVARHHFWDGTSVTLPGLSHGGVRTALDAALGTGAGDRWSEVLNRARTTWEATRRPLLEEPRCDRPSAARVERPHPPPLDPYPARRRRGLLRRRSPTLAEVAADELRDPRLAALLESHARAHGLLPERTPASAAVLAYLEHTFGCWYVAGGMRALAQAVYERCRTRGVRFQFGTAVARVRRQDGRATGVELVDGRTAPANVVVLAGGPPEAAPGAGGPDGFDVPGAGHERHPAEPTTERARDGRAADRPGSGGSARFTVLLALRGRRPYDTPHRTVVHGTRHTVNVLRPDDPLLRPDEQHESVVLSVPVREQVTEPEALAEELLTLVESAGLGLRERELWRVLRTPANNAAETGVPGGAVPAPALAGEHGACLRPANRTPLDGLYLAGGWAHPGGGLAHAGMSGALVAGLIVEGDDWHGSS